MGGVFERDDSTWPEGTVRCSQGVAAPGISMQGMRRRGASQRDAQRHVLSISVFFVYNRNFSSLSLSLLRITLFRAQLLSVRRGRNWSANFCVWSD